MSWICPCGASNADDRRVCSCGYRLQTTSQWGLGGPKLGKLLTIFAAGLIALIVGFALPELVHTPGKKGSAPAASAHTPSAILPPVAADPREQHLADLHKKRDAIEMKLAIEREMAKKVARDAMKLSMEPLADPDERQYLMEQMDKEEQRMAELARELKLIDAEIAEQEQQPGHKQTLPIPPPPGQHAERIAELRQRREEIAAEIHRKSALADDVYRDQFRCSPGAVGSPATCAGRERMKYGLGQATQQVIFDLIHEVNQLGEEAKHIDTAIANLKAGRPENWVQMEATVAPAQPPAADAAPQTQPAVH